MCVCLEAYYPETLRRAFLINAPLYARIGWAIVKTFMDPVTVSKVVILGTDYRGTLLEYIDADQLPVEFGGTH